MTTILVLASQSPRRRQLLGLLNLPLIVAISGADEEVDEGADPVLYVNTIAQRKAELVAALPTTRSYERPIVIAADTTVVIDGQILGKPQSPDEAVIMLQQLRGRDHLVHTGLCILDLNTSHRYVEAQSAIVTMRDYSDDEIVAYVNTGDPLDKAGAYGIQHNIFHPVARLQGCYLGVMGLSLCQLIMALRPYGLAANLNTADLSHLHEGFDCPLMQQLL